MIEIARHKLANGLQIVHNKNAGTGMAAVNLLYKVGSKDESPIHTGLAHLCEHLMFGGTKEAPNFDSVLLEAGGRNNAWTNNDITNYYETLPTCNIETAFWLEADRMQNLLLDDKSIEVQRKVVQEEFKQRYLNAPYGDVWHILRDMAYKKHPYRWPVIGKHLNDIETVSPQTIREFYNRHYCPNNAILSVVGDIDSDEIFKLAEKWFCGIPSSESVNSEICEEPEQLEDRELTVKKDVPHNMLLKAYHMCSRQGDKYPVYDLLSDILANGRSSRFYRNIFAKGNLVSSIDASISGDVHPGLFLIKAQLLPGISYETIERAIDEEINKLISDGVNQQELQKATNMFEMTTLSYCLTNESRAAELAYYEMLGDANGINHEIDKYRKVTTDDIANLAKNMFENEHGSTLYYKTSRT